VHALDAARAPSIVDADIAAIEPPQLIEPLAERGVPSLILRIGFGTAIEDANAPRLATLLRPRRERPRCGGNANKCDKFPSPHRFAHAEDYVGYEKIITFLD
jgi:hypothetical protein